MNVAEMLRKSREAAGISQEDLAKSLSIPSDLVAFIENPVDLEERIIEFFASGLGITPEVFKGERPPKPKEPTEEEKRELITKNARFPLIRLFILDNTRCEDPEKAMKLFGDSELSLAEQNIILYLSTTALYNFCDTNCSSFSFDKYLFNLHGKLLVKFEKELQESNLSPEEMEERLGNARSNIFACDSIEDIAINIIEPFAKEMEEKLAGEIYDFEGDLDMPFVWGIDDTLMRIIIKDQNGNIRDRIRLLDVKKKNES